MFTNLGDTLQNTLQSVIEVISPFSLSNLPGFPYIRYMAQLDAYKELDSWYTGSILLIQVEDKKTGRHYERYPLKLNPIKGTCEKHVAMLFGLNLDSINPGGIPIKMLVDPKSKLSDSDKEKVELALKTVWADNAGGPLMLSNALISQYLGGCSFTAAWIPEDKRIRINNPNPKEFIGIPDGNDYWNLREAWVVKELNRIDLIQYGFDPDLKDRKWHYIEHWTRDEYSVSINDKPLQVSGKLTKGKNPFGEVCAVYIPHIRTWSFYGNPIITDTVKGLVRELNLRWADIGDAVSEDSHGYVWVRNVRGSTKALHLFDGRNVHDLGSNPGITGNEANPELNVAKAQSASEPMLKLGNELYDMYRREVYHPAIADGEDEGSQRSGTTLSGRMWPIAAHAELERIYWTNGLNIFNKKLLKMMANKKLYDITKEMVDAPLLIQWPPMLPKDRDALVQEAAVRAKLGQDPEQLFQLLGDESGEAVILPAQKARKGIKPPTDTYGGTGQVGNDTADPLQGGEGGPAYGVSAANS